MKSVAVAESAGFCFGVERSIRMAEEALETGACCSLGELIHNEDVVNALSGKGLRVAETVEEMPEGARVVIRSNGIGERV